MLCTDSTSSRSLIVLGTFKRALIYSTVWLFFCINHCVLATENGISTNYVWTVEPIRKAWFQESFASSKTDGVYASANQHHWTGFRVIQHTAKSQSQSSDCKHRAFLVRLYKRKPLWKNERVAEMVVQLQSEHAGQRTKAAFAYLIENDQKNRIYNFDFDLLEVNKEMFEEEAEYQLRLFALPCEEHPEAASLRSKINHQFKSISEKGKKQWRRLGAKMLLSKTKELTDLPEQPGVMKVLLAESDYFPIHTSGIPNNVQEQDKDVQSIDVLPVPSRQESQMISLQVLLRKTVQHDRIRIRIYNANTMKVIGKTNIDPKDIKQQPISNKVLKTVLLTEHSSEPIIIQAFTRSHWDHMWRTILIYRSAPVNLEYHSKGKQKDHIVAPFLNQVSFEEDSNSLVDNHESPLKEDETAEKHISENPPAEISSQLPTTAAPAVTTEKIHSASHSFEHRPRPVYSKPKRVLYHDEDDFLPTLYFDESSDEDEDEEKDVITELRTFQPVSKRRRYRRIPKNPYKFDPPAPLVVVQPKKETGARPPRSSGKAERGSKNGKKKEKKNKGRKEKEKEKEKKNKGKKSQGSEKKRKAQKFMRKKKECATCPIPFEFKPVEKTFVGVSADGTTVHRWSDTEEELDIVEYQSKAHHYLTKVFKNVANEELMEMVHLAHHHPRKIDSFVVTNNSV